MAKPISILPNQNFHIQDANSLINCHSIKIISKKYIQSATEHYKQPHTCGLCCTWEIAFASTYEHNTFPPFVLNDFKAMPEKINEKTRKTKKKQRFSTYIQVKESQSNTKTLDSSETISTPLTEKNSQSISVRTKSLSQRTLITRMNLDVIFNQPTSPIPICSNFPNNPETPHCRKDKKLKLNTQPPPISEMFTRFSQKNK